MIFVYIIVNGFGTPATAHTTFGSAVEALPKDAIIKCNVREGVYKIEFPDGERWEIIRLGVVR
jgi:hypothetical protein